MKKIFLFFLLLAFVTSANWVFSNSLSPPQSFVKIVPQQMLQPATCEAPQIDAVLFECDASFVSLKNQSFLSALVANRIEVISFQILTKKNDASTTGKSDVILEAISPTCRTVITSDFYQSALNPSNAVEVVAISPKCRTVFFSYVISPSKCLIAAISPSCRDVSLIG